METNMETEVNRLVKDILEYMGRTDEDIEIKYIRQCLIQAYLLGGIKTLKNIEMIRS